MENTAGQQEATAAVLSQFQEPALAQLKGGLQKPMEINADIQK